MNHHLESLGWTLVNFCWQAAVVAFIYWLADAALSKARSHTRYVLALAALLLMLLGALATFAFEETRAQSELPLPGVSSSHATVAIGSSLPIDLGPLTVVTRQPVLHLSRFLPWLDVVWLLGVVSLSTRTIGGWRLIERLRRSALAEAPEALRTNFARLCKRLGLTRNVSLRISEHVQGPLAVGIVRSLIILPASALMALSPEQLESVLLHELAHVRRGDYLWNLIQTAMETLFFFHPAVWWLGRRLRQQRELCCDDVAVQSCGDPLIYATALLRLEERRRQPLSLAMALDGHRSSSGLRLRIARVLGETGGENGSRELAPLPVAAILTAILLAILTVPQLFAGLRKTVEPESPALAIATPSSYIPAATTLELTASAPSTVAGARSTARMITSAVLFTPAGAGGNNGGADKAAADGRGAGKGTGEGAGDGSGSSAAEQKTGDAAPRKTDYIDGMRAAGYDVDVDKYIAMKVQGITPEYAQAMANVGFGKPSAEQLIAMKIQGVTPEYVSGLRNAGLPPGSIGDLVSYRIFHVTPEFLSGMKAAGFDSISPKQLVELRIQGVTPDYAKTVKQQYPAATVDELVQLRIFHIDDAFLAAAKRHGFASLSIQKLVQLRISGVLGDEDTETK